MIDDKGVADAEQVIRDMAATVINLVNTRQFHPTYGISKARVREGIITMDGAISLYMVLTGQSLHAAGVARLATFTDSRTDARVAEARSAAEGVK